MLLLAIQGINELLGKKIQGACRKNYFNLGGPNVPIQKTFPMICYKG